MSHTSAGIIMPLHPPHFRAGLTFVRSYCALASHFQHVTIAFVLSSPVDKRDWLAQLHPALRCCRPLLQHIVSVDWEEMMRKQHGRAETLEQTCGLNKYGIQAVKKMYALRHFHFERALVLDAESRLIKPLNVSQFLGAASGFWAAPSFWYTTIPQTTDAAVLLVAAIALTGRLDMSWAEMSADGEIGSSVFDVLGLVRRQYVQDVQHWMYSNTWVEALSQRLEQIWGSVAAAVCGPHRPGGEFAARIRLPAPTTAQSSWVHDAIQRWRMFETVLSFSFAINSSHIHSSSTYNTNDVLQASGLGVLRSRPRETSSTGELLLRHYTDELQARTLAFLDNPTRPIWTFRDPSWMWPNASRAERSDAMRRLVCQSDFVPFAVCAPLAQPFYCTVSKQVVLGVPQPACPGEARG